MTDVVAKGWIHEGAAGHLAMVPDANCRDLRPLYRAYHATAFDHFLTTTDDELNNAISTLGYVHERIIGYCSLKPTCGATLALNRFFHAGSNDHFYTVSARASSPPRLLSRLRLRPTTARRGTCTPTRTAARGSWSAPSASFGRAPTARRAARRRREVRALVSYFHARTRVFIVSTRRDERRR